MTDAGVQPVYSLRVETDDHSFITNGFVSHNTEARLTPLAMEMLREIDEETVDFIPNYDGRVQEPTVLPSRFPNLLANGSGGIAVGMATNMPPHNLRELAEAVFWCLDNYEAEEEATLAAVTERVKGPDFPTYGLIVGSQGIHDAYTTGRGSIRMRGVVEIEEDSKGRTLLVITELPYQVNHDNFITSIADQVRDGKLAGISNIEDQGSDRVGMRIVVEIKRDAVAKVVLNNLYKHTQLQTSFGANMLSIVDGVPRTLRIDQLIRLYVVHQLDVIVRRTTYRLRKANERAHILRGLVKALDALDEVIALIRASADSRHRAGGPDRDARHRRHPGPGDPGYAAAAPGRPGTSAHHRRPGQDRGRDRRPRGHPGQAGASAGDRARRTRGARREVRRRPAHPDHPGRRRCRRRGSDRPRRGRRHDHRDRLRQAHQVGSLPQPEARRQGRPGRGPQTGRHRQALLRRLHPRLDPVLHHAGPGVPGEGLRAPGGVQDGPRAARREPARLPAGGAHRAGHPDQELRGCAVPGAWPPATGW